MAHQNFDRPNSAWCVPATISVSTQAQAVITAV
jgi:hypothetical protein